MRNWGREETLSENQAQQRRWQTTQPAAASYK